MILTIEEIKRRIEKKHNGIVTLDESTYVNVNRKARFIHSEYGEWWGWVGGVLAGKSHTLCKIKKQMSDIEDVKLKIKEIHGDNITILENTYSGIGHKSTFLDKDYGSWIACVNNILNGRGHKKRSKEKTITTSLKKYGVSSPNKNKEVALKQAKSQTKSCTIKHWKTNRELRANL